jgi:hypothetical protein
MKEIKLWLYSQIAWFKFWPYIKGLYNLYTTAIAVHSKYIWILPKKSNFHEKSRLYKILILSALRWERSDFSGKRVYESLKELKYALKSQVSQINHIKISYLMIKYFSHNG